MVLEAGIYDAVLVEARRFRNKFDKRKPVGALCQQLSLYHKDSNLTFTYSWDLDDQETTDEVLKALGVSYPRQIREGLECQMSIGRHNNFQCKQQMFNTVRGLHPKNAINLTASDLEETLPSDILGDFND